MARPGGRRCSKSWMQKLEKDCSHPCGVAETLEGGQGPPWAVVPHEEEEEEEEEVTLELNEHTFSTNTSSKVTQQLLLMKVTHFELCRSEHVENSLN
jgi:hypothetical protein